MGQQMKTASAIIRNVLDHCYRIVFPCKAGLVRVPPSPSESFYAGFYTDSVCTPMDFVFSPAGSVCTPAGFVRTPADSICNPANTVCTIAYSLCAPADSLCTQTDIVRTHPDFICRPPNSLCTIARPLHQHKGPPCFAQSGPSHLAEVSGQPVS